MASTSSPIVYLIRHGEKPSNGGDGLTSQGEKRAEGLVSIFGKDSRYDLGLIIAEHPKNNGERDRPYLTVKPLADSLGVPFDYSIARDDADKVAQTVKDFNGAGNILICWEHGQLTRIAEALGVKGDAKYPGDRFDIIWTVDAPYDKINDITSEHVPGLDNGSTDGTQVAKG